MIDMFCAGGQARLIEDDVNLSWYFKDLLLSYKFGEKFRFEKAFNKLKPYLSDTLIHYFEEIHDDSLWLNPITGKKGF